MEKVKELVSKLLKGDNSGHGMEHINRVLNLSLKFAKEEKADLNIVALSALLHDVDDYKLVGRKKARDLTNAKKIMEIAKIEKDIQKKVLKIIRTMGYNKLLKGIRPDIIEGKIVSDADMCDALGSNGILRSYAFSLKNNRLFFDKDIWPIEDISYDDYVKRVADTSVCHMFEKILTLKDLMLTESGYKEALKRHNIVVDFLRNLFEEEEALDWLDYLNNYLLKEKNNVELKSKFPFEC